ncbi:hypothetical protein DEU56DRAFT_952358 [Suillus clintonianus]|uniref:uncharacterized protein n=1 Tax=Suillus clintonianus TaxID=1904413 RepID=UPI001B869BCD|nr:uncharacterized protein DEU56DRAFT_952358 [Suillus clintonianus]KAG2132742.1 hypothetical protein DEU56DRAFT_952358 [Suillus clintonianus]
MYFLLIRSAHALSDWDTLSEEGLVAWSWRSADLMVFGLVVFAGSSYTLIFADDRVFLKRTIESWLNGANNLQADGSDIIIMLYLPVAVVEFILQVLLRGAAILTLVSHISDPTVDTSNTINSLDLHDFLPSCTSYKATCTPKVTSTAPHGPPGLLVYTVGVLATEDQEQREQQDRLLLPLSSSSNCTWT